MWGLPPALDMEYEKRVQTAIREIVVGGHVESAHDLSDGGLAVALSEGCSGGVGAAVEVSSDWAMEIRRCFTKGPSRILVSYRGAGSDREDRAGSWGRGGEDRRYN